MTETEAKWTERVREWKASGLTAKEFTAGRDFKPSTLVYWASCLRKGTADQKPQRRVRMARVVRVDAASDAAVTVAIGAVRVSVRAGFDPVLLRQVVRALGEGA
ncbi:MAG TPA: hypothetical protein VK841_16730 [Polyangiaceae bacterium]|nr:hypothetical protein [Polyangiaceae bacterium]